MQNQADTWSSFLVGDGVQAGFRKAGYYARALSASLRAVALNTNMLIKSAIKVGGAERARTQWLARRWPHALGDGQIATTRSRSPRCSSTGWRGSWRIGRAHARHRIGHERAAEPPYGARTQPQGQFARDCHGALPAWPAVEARVVGDCGTLACGPRGLTATTLARAATRGTVSWPARTWTSCRGTCSVRACLLKPPHAGELSGR